MEKQLLEQLQNGDERAFKSIYDQHYTLLCRFANYFLQNSSLAEEVVGDAIFNLWRQRERLEVTHSVRAYLMRSVRNGCLNELRSLASRKEVALSTASLPERGDFLATLLVEDEQPLGLLLEKELESEVHRAMEELPAECKLVFMKSRLEQKKYLEIAEELGISVNTVKYHIKSALSFMQSRLEKYMNLLVLYCFYNFQ